MTTQLAESRTNRGADGPIVVGALHSAQAAATAMSCLGRRAFRLASVADFTQLVDREDACAILFELGHPAFTELQTRLSVVGTHVPLVLVLPPDRLPAAELFVLARIARFSLAYSHREIPSVLRRTMARGNVSSDAGEVAASLGDLLAPKAATLALGLYVMGTRNVTVGETAVRLGSSGALRNRLRTLGLARASTILGWASAMGIVWRMENEECSLTDAARAAGFATTRQCSDRVLYHTGRTPTALREHYGFQALVGEFVDVVRARVSSAA